MKKWRIRVGDDKLVGTENLECYFKVGGEREGGRRHERYSIED